jgi:hypothetical protein
MLKNTFLSSFPRRRESRNGRKEWIPACAGMTSEGRAEKSAVYLLLDISGGKNIIIPGNKGKRRKGNAGQKDIQESNHHPQEDR